MRRCDWFIILWNIILHSQSKQWSDRIINYWPPIAIYRDHCPMSNSLPIIVHLSSLKGSPTMSISLIMDPSMGIVLTIRNYWFHEYLPSWHTWWYISFRGEKCMYDLLCELYYKINPLSGIYHYNKPFCRINLDNRLFCQIMVA